MGNKKANIIVEDSVIEPYFIQIDDNQFAVRKRSTSEHYKPQPLGFYTTFEQAVKSLIEKLAHDSLRSDEDNIVSLRDYLKHYKAVKSAVLLGLDLTPTVKIESDYELKQQTSMSAGFDLQSQVDVVISPGNKELIMTGIKVALPEGYEAQVRPRSGLALKHSITVLNSPGTIDADYRGDVGVILMNHSNVPFTINKGDRIAQLVFNQIAALKINRGQVTDDTERGEGGYGSTGIS